MFEEVIARTKFNELSSNPSRRWIELAKIASKIVIEKTEQSMTAYGEREILLEYNDFLNHISSELQIEVMIPDVPASEKLKTNIYLHNIDRICENLEASVQKEIFTKLLKGEVSSDKDSEDTIEISNRGVVEIHNRLNALKSSVIDIVEEKDKREELLSALHKFEIMLNSKRLSKASAWATVALIAAGIGGATSFFADAPEAAQTLAEIASVIGVEIEEDEKRKALPPTEKPEGLLPPPDIEAQL